MTPAQWREVRDLFEQALDVPPAEQDDWLAREAGESEVAAEVRSLLTHHSRAGAFLASPVTERVSDLLADDNRFAPGDVIGSYRIARELGRGGMGRVYLATDLRLGRDVALKVLAPDLVLDPSQRERLRREARAAASFTHPGICTVYALEEIADDVLIVSEYVEGETLRDEIARGFRPPPGEVARMASELAGTLSAAHQRGITHRDLKPENVMRAKNGTLKVLDFGLALVDADMSGLDTPRVTTPGTLVGTPAYMAPEQLSAGPVDARTDLFALGVLLYEYATGHHPFEASSPLALAARILEGEHRPVFEARPDLSPTVTMVIERCLRKRPSERHPSAADILRELASTGGAPLPLRPSSNAAWWRTHLWTVLALYLIVAVVGWMVKEWEHGLADGGFVLVAMLVVAGGMLRAHLLFAERNHDFATFRAALVRTTPALNGVDLALAATLLLEGLLVARTRSVPGVLIIGLGIGLALARLVLERSTTAAAFSHKSQVTRP